MYGWVYSLSVYGRMTVACTAQRSVSRGPLLSLTLTAQIMERRAQIREGLHSVEVTHTHTRPHTIPYGIVPTQAFLSYFLASTCVHIRMISYGC
jgi:hypothetical protein